MVFLPVGLLFVGFCFELTGFERPRFEWSNARSGARHRLRETGSTAGGALRTPAAEGMHRSTRRGKPKRLGLKLEFEFAAVTTIATIAAIAAATVTNIAAVAAITSIAGTAAIPSIASIVPAAIGTTVTRRIAGLL
jgi:hypothetical protein